MIKKKKRNNQARKFCFAYLTLFFLLMLVVSCGNTNNEKQLYDISIIKNSLGLKFPDSLIVECYSEIRGGPDNVIFFEAIMNKEAIEEFTIENKLNFTPGYIYSYFSYNSDDLQDCLKIEELKSSKNDGVVSCERELPYNKSKNLAQYFNIISNGSSTILLIYQTTAPIMSEGK